MLLNNQRFKEEVKKYLETNETGKTTDQSIWDAAKSILRGKSVVTNAYLKKQKRSQINKLTLHLKELKEQIKPKVNRRKKITN